MGALGPPKQIGSTNSGYRAAEPAKMPRSISMGHYTRAWAFPGRTDRVSAAPQAWPFCWWVVVVLDRLLRRAHGFIVIARKPDAQTCCAFPAAHPAS
jgi:hypothetical protein